MATFYPLPGQKKVAPSGALRRARMNVYFYDSHSPSQRGTCEHTSGLLRGYLPEGKNLSVDGQDELDAIADNLNSRPRATHAFHSRLEIFAATLASASQAPSSKHKSLLHFTLEPPLIHLNGFCIAASIAPTRSTAEE